MGAHDYLRFVLALAAVLALMALLGYVMRRLNLGGTGKMGGSAGRLEVVETRPVDHRHKLILVKCDNREHLLLLSPENQTVIDSNIPAKGQP